jgi:hypothetical protein
MLHTSMNLSHVQCLAVESDEFGNPVRWGKNSGVDLWLTSVDPEHCSLVRHGHLARKRALVYTNCVY